jgi:hypothetical protein
MELNLSVTRFFMPALDESKEISIIKEQKGKCKSCQIDIRKHYRINQDKEGGEHYALCPVCYFSQHLELLPNDSAGRIVMMPNFTQNEIIVLSRTIAMFSKLDAESYSDEIDDAMLLKMLMEENYNQAEMFYAPGASEVELVAQVLSNQDDESYKKRDEGLYGLRWIPDYSYFDKEVEYWYKQMFDKEKAPYHPSKWEDFSKKIKAKVKKQ